MARSNDSQQNSLQIVKGLMKTKEMQRRFTEILGQKAPQFMASIVNAMSNNQQLQRCDANSIMSAALVAATFDLPIDNNLGFSAIVPYGNMAQFQIMYKGFIQLAIRSGYYERMNYAVVYEDELASHNPITGDITFVSDFTKCTQRMQGKDDKIVGYYAWFKLKTGFIQEVYMSRSEVDHHARKYSQSYRYDLNNGRKGSRWSTDFDAMAKKTVIKLLLSKWGILSVDMQRAIQDDQKVFTAAGTGSYIDSNSQPEAVDAFTVDNTDASQPPPTQPLQEETAQKKAAIPAAVSTPDPASDDADYAAYEASLFPDSSDGQEQLPWD